jgi:flagellar export protein FliJ
MTGFAFTLQKVLDWRRAQLGIEEIRFRQQASEIANIGRQRAELAASLAAAEAQIRREGGAPGSDLAALGNFRLYVQAKDKALAARWAECEKRLAEQRNAMLAARRRCALLERLKERRQAEWEAARNRELEELASDSFLAQWNRRQA